MRVRLKRALLPLELRQCGYFSALTGPEGRSISGAEIRVFTCLLGAEAKIWDWIISGIVPARVIRALHPGQMVTHAIGNRRCLDMRCLWRSYHKEFTCNAGDSSLIPGSGRSPGEGNGHPLQYSGLENSTDCIVHGVTKSWTRLNHFHVHFQDTLGFLSGGRIFH